MLQTDDMLVYFRNKTENRRLVDVAALLAYMLQFFFAYWSKPRVEIKPPTEMPR